MSSAIRIKREKFVAMEHKENMCFIRFAVLGSAVGIAATLFYNLRKQG